MEAAAKTLVVLREAQRGLATPWCAAEDSEASATPAAGSSAAAAPTASAGSKRPAVLADGTYATQVRGRGWGWGWG